jgi:hypothetical protein
MPTQEQLRHYVDEFERQYPESLSDRIQWWARVLDVDHTRLFRLLGLSGPEAARTPRTALPRVVESHEEQAEYVDDMLGLLLASFDYDLSALRSAMHRPPDSASGEMHEGTRQPDEDTPLPYTPSPRVRDGILLNMIAAGGSVALSALQAYLSETKGGNGRRKGRKG